MMESGMPFAILILSEYYQKTKPLQLILQGLNFVGVLGFEPRMTGPESVVLPLHHTPIMVRKPLQKYSFFLLSQSFLVFLTQQAYKNTYFHLIDT